MDGTAFGRYRLIELLGRGGMGEVWRAHDTNTDRIVAVKVLPAQLATDPSFEQRFRREAHAAARLHHPHIVPIHDYGEIDGRLYVDMALIDGHDLAGEIATGPLDPARAVTIVEHIAGALQAAHRAGLVHRDVKPSNILLDVDDNAYLIDFGIARAATDSALTGTGNTLGTFNYMAPERFTSDDIDHRSDIYALACVLYEALTGTRTFPGDTLQRQIAGHLNTPPPKPSAVGLSPAFDDIIATGLAKDPEQRYQNAKDLAAAARNALAAPAEPTTPTVQRPIPAAQPLSEPAVVAASTIVIAEPPVSAWQGPPTEHIAKPARTAAPKRIVDHYGGSATPQPQGAAMHRLDRSPRRKPVIIVALVIAAIAGVVAALEIVTNARINSQSATQVELPFAGLHGPFGIAVDSTGAVYVADQYNNRVLKLASGADQATELPLSGLRLPTGVAVDDHNNVYIIDKGYAWDDRIVRYDTATNSQSATGLPKFQTRNIAISRSGGVFVTDWSERIVELAIGHDTFFDLKIKVPGVSRLQGIALDDAGDIYVLAVANNSFDGRLFKYAAGTNTESEIPLGLFSPEAIAVDASGNIYVAESAGSQVVKLDATNHNRIGQYVMGERLGGIHGIAVDTAGNVYVTDDNANRVLKLPVE